jgi:hypothetical protein
VPGVVSDYGRGGVSSFCSLGGCSLRPTVSRWQAAGSTSRTDDLFRLEMCSVRQTIKIPSSARSRYCCARLRVAVRLATSLAPFQAVFGGQRVGREDVTVLVRKRSLRTHLRFPNPNRRTHLTGKGSHDHWGLCPSFCQGSGIRPSRALRGASTPLGKVGFGV